jgi:hypothetical protein
MGSNVHVATIETRDVGVRLDLSEGRAHDAALDILGAYKLTGNFHVNLEVVLKSMGCTDDITFEVAPKSSLLRSSGRRRVVFRPSRTVEIGRFDALMRSISDRIAFREQQPLWQRLLRWSSLHRAILSEVVRSLARSVARPFYAAPDCRSAGRWPLCRAYVVSPLPVSNSYV